MGSEMCIRDRVSRGHDRVLVGYNRRFYLPVRRAREEVRSGVPLLARLSLPEGVDPDDRDSTKSYLEPFFENSCHGLDLIRYVFGDLQVKNVRRLTRGDGRLVGLTALLSTARGDLVQFEGNWGVPANFALSLQRPGRRFELCPFEQATIYEGMDVIEPTDSNHIRRYVPREVEHVELDPIDLSAKPGFVAQASVLSDLVEGKPAPLEAANLDDAHAAIKLCEQLVGTPYARVA